MNQWITVVAMDKIPQGLSKWVKNRRRIVIVREDQQIKAVFNRMADTLC